MSQSSAPEPAVEVEAAPPQARREWDELAEQVRAARFAYYVRDAPTLADGEFGHFSRAAAELTVVTETLTLERAAEQIDTVVLAATTHRRPAYLSVPQDLALAHASGNAARISEIEKRMSALDKEIAVMAAENARKRGDNP